MIKKQKKLVITFYTTTEAMAMEKACKEEGADGRMIPVPRVISAGSGLAWASQPQKEEILRELMKKRDIRFQEIVECMV